MQDHTRFSFLILVIAAATIGCTHGDAPRLSGNDTVVDDMPPEVDTPAATPVDTEERRPAEVRDPTTPSFYGNPFGADAVGHTPKYAKAAYRFRALETGEVSAITVHNRVVYRRPSDSTFRELAERCGLDPDTTSISTYDACAAKRGFYSYLDGGKVRVELRELDGSNLPGDTVLARAERDYVPEKEPSFFELAWSKPAKLVNGKLYAIVYTQVGTSGGSVVLNGSWITHPGSTPADVTGPFIRDDFATFYQVAGNGKWLRRANVVPMFELSGKNAGGEHVVWGPGLSGHSSSGHPKAVGGAARVRQTMTPQHDVSPKALWLRAFRQEGPGAMTVTIRDARGAAKVSMTIDASRFDAVSPYEGTVRWVRVPIPELIVLGAKALYTLELSAPEGTRYQAMGIQTLKQFETRDAFRDGLAEYSTNDGQTWSGGWDFEYHYSPGKVFSKQVDLSFAFEL